MNARYIAGRHGAFTTQFSKQPPSSTLSKFNSNAKPRSHNKLSRNIERSRNAIERRLTLPLDEHNWIRALEVLRARYAQQGVKPEYYQRVLRTMVEPYIQARCNKLKNVSLYEFSNFAHDGNNNNNNNSNTNDSNNGVDRSNKGSVDVGAANCQRRITNAESTLTTSWSEEGKAYKQATVSASNAFDLSNGRGNVIEGIDSIRDAVFAEEIPVNASLWVTLIWAYVNVDEPLLATETIELSLRRFTFSEQTILHMLQLVYEPLCMKGKFIEVKELITLLKQWHKHQHLNSERTSATSNLINSFLLTRNAKTLYAEAAALHGNWQCALEVMQLSISHKETTHTLTSNDQISSLFDDNKNKETYSMVTANTEFIEHERKSSNKCCLENSTLITNSTNNNNFSNNNNNQANMRTNHQTHISSLTHPKQDNETEEEEERQNATITTPTKELQQEKKSFIYLEEPNIGTCLRLFSKRALSSLLTALCHHNKVELARLCWDELYGPFHTLSRNVKENENVAEENNIHRLCFTIPTVYHIRCMLNCLCTNAEIDMAIELFERLFLPFSSSSLPQSSLYQQLELRESKKLVTMETRFALDEVILNIIFSAFPTQEIKLFELDVILCEETSELHRSNNSHAERKAYWLNNATRNSSLSEYTLRAVIEPERVVRLFERLIETRDDMQITDYVMAVIGPALLQTAVNAALFDKSNKKPFNTTTSITTITPLSEWEEERHAYTNSDDINDSSSVSFNEEHSNNNGSSNNSSSSNTIKDRAKSISKTVERVVWLLCQTPLLNSRKVLLHESHEKRALKKHLMTIVYYCYFSQWTNDEIRCILLKSLPHLFPPERFHTDLKRFQKINDTCNSENTQQHELCMKNVHGTVKKSCEISSNNINSNNEKVNRYNHNIRLDDNNNSSNNNNRNDNVANGNFERWKEDKLDDIALMKEKWSLERNVNSSKSVHSRRFERQNYFPLTSTTHFTESSESKMKDNFVRLYRNRSNAFGGTHSAADNDPRPIPKGIHDRVSGWNFAGRNGEMMFANNSRATNLLNMQPKVMRALANPYRSWNPRQNSSLAHLENVKKWNKKSAM